MAFSGGEVTEKGFARGWDPSADDQASQRALRITQLLEAFVFRPWAWNPHESKRLTYAYNGGMVDNGAAWTVIADGTIALNDGETNYIERNDIGAVQVVLGGFTYPGWVPMASVEASAGAIVTNTYIDHRPEIGGAPSGGAGAITFPMIVGQILDSQVPLSSVAQYLTKANLPASIAYEDETNLFLLLQSFANGLVVDTIDEFTLDAGVTIEGVLLKDGDIETAKKALQLDEIDGSEPAVTYLGKAAPGAITSAATWSIQQITEQSDGDIAILWADGDSAEDNIWDNRLALSYS